MPAKCSTTKQYPSPQHYGFAMKCSRVRRLWKQSLAWEPFPSPLYTGFAVCPCPHSPLIPLHSSRGNWLALSDPSIYPERWNYTEAAYPVPSSSLKRRGNSRELPAVVYTKDQYARLVIDIVSKWWDKCNF